MHRISIVSFGIVPVLLTMPMWAQQASQSTTSDKMRVGVDLVDGSRIIGVPENNSVTIRTSFAEIQIPLDQVRMVTWAEDRENVVVHLHNEDVISGGIVPEPLRLTTLFGPVNISMNLAVALETIPPEVLVSPPIRDGLMLYFPFDKDEGGMASNRVGDRHHATVEGAEWTESGARGGAYRFSGDYDVLSIEDHPDLQPPQFTLCAWVFADDKDLSTYRGIVTKTTSSSWSSGFGLVRYPGDNQAHFFVNYYSGDNVSTTLEEQTWTHLASSYDGETMVLYKNGEHVESVIPTSYGGEVRYQSGPLMIGSAPSGYGWKGKIDEVMLFDKVLTASEIRRIYDLTR